MILVKLGFAFIGLLAMIAVFMLAMTGEMKTGQIVDIAMIGCFSLFVAVICPIESSKQNKGN